jgi:TolA-binding protein
MNQLHLDTDQIRMYLSEEMSAQQQNLCERHLEICPLCADAVEGYKGMPDFQELLTEVDEKRFEATHNENKVKMMKPWFYVAIAAAILLGIFWGANQLMSNHNPESLFASEFLPYTNDIAAKNRGEKDSLFINLTADFNNAMSFYDKKDFKTAIGKFNTFLEQDPGNTIAFFYLGNALLHENQPEEAFRYFKSVDEDITSPYQPVVAWQLGMCCLKMEEIPAAKQYFKEVADGNGFYKEQAEKILGELE